MLMFGLGQCLGEEQCPDLPELAQRRLPVSLSSLAGSWLSVRCETRPGPGFVLRHYQWSHLTPSLVTGVLYHYADPDCRQPLYSLIFQASTAHFRPSWLLPGQLGALAQSLTSHCRRCGGLGVAGAGLGETLQLAVSSQVGGEDITRLSGPED